MMLHYNKSILRGFICSLFLAAIVLTTSTSLANSPTDKYHIYNFNTNTNLQKNGDDSYDIDDPCECLNNSSTIAYPSGTGGDDGGFSELVAITGPNGSPIVDQTLDFRIANGTLGVLDAFNVTAPAGVPVTIGTQMVYNTVTGHYEIPFVHLDGEGYTIVIQQFVTEIPGQIFSIGNHCSYPEPVFDPVLPTAPIEFDAAPITLGGTDQLGGSANGSPTFTIDGNPATSIDPSVLGPGTYTVVMTFNGADDGQEGIGTSANSALRGCTQTATQSITISAPPIPTLSEWGMIVLSLFLLIGGVLYLIQPIFYKQ